jgi:hypothetical protein
MRVLSERQRVEGLFSSTAKPHPQMTTTSKTRHTPRHELRPAGCKTPIVAKTCNIVSQRPYHHFLLFRHRSTMTLLTIVQNYASLWRVGFAQSAEARRFPFLALPAFAPPAFRLHSFLAFL